MTLVVENGTGLANANAYLTLAEADAYFQARNNTVWQQKTNPDKEAAILYATSFLDSNFYWLGHIKVYNQAIGWPRILVYDKDYRNIDSDSVPRRVKDATAELALEATQAPLSPSLASGGGVKRQKVASLEIEYFDNANPQRTYPLVRQLLNGLYKDSPTAELFRA